jgi:PadR family transcriptional regulator AphA
MSTWFMATSRTTTSYALLGLLNIKPWTTYELAKQVQRGLGWFWPRAERKLYEEPKKLVAAGLATATEQRTGNRPRTVYAITGAGRKELRSWLGDEAEPPALEFAAMVKLFFADGGTLAQMRVTLQRVEATATERQGELQAMIDATNEGPYEFERRLPINALALRFQLDHEMLQIRWARWALEQIEEWNSPVDPGRWDWRSALAENKPAR